MLLCYRRTLILRFEIGSSQVTFICEIPVVLPIDRSKIPSPIIAYNYHQSVENNFAQIMREINAANPLIRDAVDFHGNGDVIESMIESQNSTMKQYDVSVNFGYSKIH